MNNKFFLGLIVLAAGVLVGWYILGGNPSTIAKLIPTIAKVTPIISPQPKLPGVDSPVESGGVMVEKGGVAARSVVMYTDTGFAPLTLSVNLGTVVTFVNESTRSMWVASAIHPTHNLLSGFDQLKSVARGGNYEYTFTKIGTWKYHNHESSADVGTIVVTQ